MLIILRMPPPLEDGTTAIDHVSHIIFLFVVSFYLDVIFFGYAIQIFKYLQFNVIQCFFKTIINQEAKYYASEIRFEEFQNGSSMFICDSQQFKTYHDLQVLAQISSFELFHHGSATLVNFCLQHSKRKWF